MSTLYTKGREGERRSILREKEISSQKGETWPFKPPCIPRVFGSCRRVKVSKHRVARAQEGERRAQGRGWIGERKKRTEVSGCSLCAVYVSHRTPAWVLGSIPRDACGDPRMRRGGQRERERERERERRPRERLSKLKRALDIAIPVNYERDIIFSGVRGRGSSSATSPLRSRGLPRAFPHGCTLAIFRFTLALRDRNKKKRGTNLVNEHV